MRTAALSLVLLAALPAVSAAEPATTTIHSDTREVRACLPLADGGVLVGTGGGLVRLGADGTRRAVWTAADGLPGTRVELLAADGDGFWLGADDGGARLALAGDRLTVTQTWRGRSWRAVVRHDGGTYAATWEGGVVRVRGGRTEAVPFKGRARGQARVTALASQGGTLWAGTAAGLFARRGKRLVRVALVDGPTAPAVSGLVADGDRLWIATSDGLFVREAGTIRHLAGGDLRAVAMLDGAVTTAGIGNGVRVLDRGRLLTPAGGPQLRLAQAVGAGAGAACAGGLDGLWRRDAGGSWRAFATTAAVALPSNDVSALASDGARLWVGTFDRGLAVRDGDGWRTLADPALDPRINALLIEPRPTGSRLWIGTAAGLMSLDDDGVARVTRRDGLPGRGVLSLARLRDGRVVVGTTTGAAVLGARGPVALGPPGQEVGNVWAVAEDADGRVWLGTTTGVWRGPATTRRKGERVAGWQRLSLATGHLRDDWVMALATDDAARVVWVGGYKGGVVRFDLGPAEADAAPTATWLGDGWVNPGGLRWDGVRLWASTQDGLRTGDGVHDRWRTEPGLPGKDVTATAQQDAIRWIATRRGLVEQR